MLFDDSIKYFDIHSHIQFPEFDVDRTEVLARMKEREVGAFVVGTDLESSQKGVSLAEKHDNIYATIGLHPNDNRKEVFDREKYAELAKNPNVVAVGECGLDYFRGTGTPEEKKRQKALFSEHIDLAAEYNLPLMVHVRSSTQKGNDAHEDVLALLTEKREIYGDTVRGDIHFFSGNFNIAKKYFDIGFTTSFTGVITFTDDYNDTVAGAPLDMLMTETDCPYVAPVPYRGKRSEPVHVIEVVKQIARVREEEEETVRSAVLENVRRVFGKRV